MQVSSFFFWLVLQILSIYHVQCALSLNIPTSHSIIQRRENRWNSAVATLEKTTKERARFDHRAKKAFLIGIYVGGGDSEVDINDKNHSVFKISPDSSSISGGGGEQEAEILVAIQPDQGGRKLLFLDANDGHSLGFIELETQSALSLNKIFERQPDLTTTTTAAENNNNHEKNEHKTSALRGMLVADDCRGKGYARLFLAIWLRLCSRAGVTPATTRINKPLLALTLVRLGFTPLRGHHLAVISNENHLRGSIRTKSKSENENSCNNNREKPKKRKKLKEKQRPLAVEVSVGTEGRVLLYSPLSTERLRNGFSVQEVKSQRLVVATEPSMPRGRIAHLRVRYAPPRHMTSVKDDNDDDDHNLIVDSSNDLDKKNGESQQMVHLPLADGMASRLRLSATQGPTTIGSVPSILERAEAMHLLTGRI
jgi:hypothetical protein